MKLQIPDSTLNSRLAIKLVVIIFIALLLIKVFSNNQYYGNVINFKRITSTESQVLKIQEIAEIEQCGSTKPGFNSTLVSCKYQSIYPNRLGIFSSSFMSDESLRTARLYINTVKYSVSNAFYDNYVGIIDGRAWPPESQCQALTMTGLRRLDNIQYLLEDVIQRNIKGDFIETGVWKGGACIFAKAIFESYQQYDRQVFLADSFDGIPPPDVNSFPVDRNHLGTNNLNILSGKKTGGVEAVKQKMNLYFNIQSDRRKITGKESRMAIPEEIDNLEMKFQIKVNYLKGYFKDTLPKAIENNLFRCFSVLRLDGDIYESTWQALEYLYPFLSPGGLIIIDDFTDWIGAHTAVHDFRKKMFINTPIIQIYHDPDNQETIRGVFFMKPLDTASINC